MNEGRDDFEYSSGGYVSQLVFLVELVSLLPFFS